MEKRARFTSRWLPYALVAPQILITILFFFWPAIQALYQSMLLQDAFGGYSEFVWFDNFMTLFRDPTYLAAFETTAVFSLLVAGFGMLLALILAVFADRVSKGASLYKTFLIWPYAVSPVVVGVLWMFLLSPSLGLISHVLAWLGISWDYMINGNQAMILIVIAAIWKQISYNFLFFLAGLQSIPKSLIEAAAIDGAGPVKRFFTIVLPLISPTTFFLMVVNIVYAFFDTFAIVEATTHGGPGKDTEILVYRVFTDGFKGGDLGGSAAQSVVLMVVVILLTVVQFKYVEKKVQYA
ncbi:sn-glycerol 3-phosphate transport system permease protein [Herbaspirillum sp. Sphag1AN]|uniref:sn-glycerol-3-phosphate ABC transporter permease UgpA n=1 Tax=unclassified Herbaspirillum TaxID=2624150 RepID=UPI0016225505|nr:sn-glycerol 3-phosphate transport system permease protein [Herbaspirillum sp. Sphag1AN]MBB3247709.1 sn-glycerol 3-phosphate transport system permease protein [Herbaspirillum sp. Sphag64]